MRAKYYFLTILIGVVTMCMLGVTPASAQVLSHQQAKVDDKIVKNDNSFSVPTTIVVVPVFPPSGDFQVRDTDWFRGIYYYMIANQRRPGFTDIPFHYIVTQDGRVFRGNSGGEERKISITDLGSNMVVIGYLAGRSDNAFDPRSKEALGELILDVANRNSIVLDRVSVATVKFRRDDQNQTVALQKQDLFGLWNSSLKQIVDGISPRYSPIPKSYAMQVVSVSLPTQEVTPGESVVGTINIKNIGEFGSYFDSSSELLAGRIEDDTSKFFLQDIWPSNSQFSVMQSSDSLLPGEEKQFTFKLFVPLYFGEQAENFQLQTIGGQTIPDSGFTLKLNVARPSGRIVEIRETETGWLRVRSSPSGAATEVARVSAGERYFVTDDAGNGWIKIRLTNGNEGWVSMQYLNFL